MFQIFFLTIFLTDENAHAVFERKVFWAIFFGPKRKGEEFRSSSNAEQYQLFTPADKVRWLKVNRLRWAGHVVRRPEEAPLNKKKRSRGRPQNSWKEAVENDGTSLGVGIFPTVARDTHTPHPNFLILIYITHIAIC